MAQLAKRVLDGDICVPFPNETRLLVPQRMKGAVHFIVTGLCEFEDMCFVLHYLKENDLFVDVGANIGAFTVLAGAVSSAKTIAIEPSPQAYGYLVQNTAINNIRERVTTIQAALGAKEGMTRLTTELGTENHIPPAADEERTTVEVKMLTLDQVITGQIPTLIKVDTEGFETEVFAGAQKTLRSYLPTLLVERAGGGARYGYDEAALHAQIRGFGYSACVYSPMDRTLHRISKDAVGNIIYVADFDLAQSRLQQARQFRYRDMAI